MINFVDNNSRILYTISGIINKINSFSLTPISSKLKFLTIKKSAKTDIIFSLYMH